MTHRSRALHVVFWLLLSVPIFAQPAALTVSSAGPTGEIANLQEANEIRIRFSEPMVAIGRIPDEVTAPFFSIRPAVSGTFRWAGPTILVFTPNQGSPLPYATRYEVTIAATASAVSGRRLEQPYSFSFTTPTVRLLSTRWYRLNGRYDRPLVIAMRFNQPVRIADVMAHTTLRHQPHTWVPPALTVDQRARIGAAEAARFDQKVRTTAAVVASQAPVPFVAAATWDRERFPPGPDLVVLETLTAPQPDAFVRLALDSGLPSMQGPATPPADQTFTIQLPQTFFVNGFWCSSQCDADRYNYLRLRAEAALTGLRSAVAIRDITDPARPVSIAATGEVRRQYMEQTSAFSLEDLGYDRQPPATTYAVTIDDGLVAEDGQTLGYTWAGVVENWRARAFTSFGDGHGVWESGGGPLPFYARNFRDATQWAAPITVSGLMPLILNLQERNYALQPSTTGVRRTFGGAPDRIESHGLDLSGALNAEGKGLVWAAVRPGEPIPNARRLVPDDRNTTASIVQVTNLGITVKDSPANTLVFVTRLDTGEPVPGAEVSIIRLDNTVFWRGKTNAQGIALASQTRIRQPRRPWQFAFIVTAAKGGDVAYAASDWNEGVEPYMFGANYDLTEAEPLLRGTVFSDRGVYKLGEEVHVKAILRTDAPSGIALIKPGTPVHVALRDSRDKLIDRRTVTVNEWSSAEWRIQLPAEGALGNYQLVASLDKEVIDTDHNVARPPEEVEEETQPWWRKQVGGGFLVAAYRRPDFRVDATLAADLPLAGTALKGAITGRYLFGAAMTKRPVTWTYTRRPVFQAPPAVTAQYPSDRFAFVGCCDEDFIREEDQIAARTGALDEKGQLALDLETRAGTDGLPYQYTLEGDVEDVSRQRIANRASTLVHPAAWYIGLRRPTLFLNQRDGLTTAVVAVSPSGRPVGGVPIEVTLTEVQWNSVRRAEGNGFYTWETERREIEVSRHTVTTAEEPVPLSIPVPRGGSYLVTATGRDADGRVSRTRMSFYSIGSGYTAWQRYDHNRIDLVPERETYKPGESARLMIQSPWERATALLTVEREGIRSQTQFTLTSTQHTVTVPITAADIPNLFVSVLLVKGRTREEAGQDEGSDPGKPAFRVGYAKLTVEDSSKRLTMNVKANGVEFEPAGTAKVEVDVTDHAGAPAQSEVTLWAVDYGVLSLTAFRTPDVLGSVYVRKALQVMTSDSRQRIVARRALTPKGADEGGGGGMEPGADQLRKDFRVLAFWVGSVTTGRDGRASVTVKLPESLTTYRIMAVAGDKVSRFGSAESEIRVNKPVVLKPAYPRFLTKGDTSFFGSVVTNQLPTAGTAIVEMKSLDPAVLQITGESRREVQVPAGGSVEVRFGVNARAIGRGRVQTTVRIGSERDGYEDAIPVVVVAPTESVAAYGQASPDAMQTLAIPAGVMPGVGGLRVEMSSTALVGLAEGARYVVEYPYGCLEQQASRAFVMAMAADLGNAFRLPGIDPANLRSRAQTTLNDLEKFQCASGGFAFWPGACASVSPYLTSYVLHVYQAVNGLGSTAGGRPYRIDARVLERAYEYLERELAAPPPVNEGWWPAYTAWEAFAVKVLVEGGRNQDSTINRLHQYLDRMPVFAIAYLHDALIAKGEAGARVTELRRRMGNAMLPEAGAVHVEELSDPYLLWFWNSNVRSTAVVLNSLVRAGDRAMDVAGMVRWLMAARQNGRWGNTQENAWAMQALVNYYRKYEAQTPNFTGTIRLGTETLIRDTFRGRSTEPASQDVPMTRLAAAFPPGTSQSLAVRRNGEGTLYYTTRLTYAPDIAKLEALDNGFRVDRRYEVMTDGRAAAPSSTFNAGDLIRVTVSLDLPKERRYVAVTDPLPAGLEALETWFATTAAEVAKVETDANADDQDWRSVWERGTFDHVERRDDRVLLFATRLSEGHHEFSYVVRAITAGSFEVPPVRAEEMYAPEIFGRSATRRIEVNR